MLKAGFIGFGRMGITHFSILNTHPSVEIVAVCDQSRVMMNIVKKYLNVATFSSYKKMIEKSDLDFVVISTPPASHAEIVKFALEHNLHIFVEKPFVTDVQQGKAILEIVKGKELVNQVGYVGRFHDIFMEVKKLLEANLIGEIKRFKAEMLGATITKDARASWRSKKNLGGGCLFEFASHSIDLIINLLGKPAKVAGSVFQSVYSSNVEDIVSSTFLYNNGMSGTVLANWSDQSYRKPTNRVEIFGKKGRVVADQYSYKVFLKDDDESTGLRSGWNTRYITDCAESVRLDVRGRVYTRQLDYFVDCIENKQSKNIINFAEALQTDIIMKNIIQEYKERCQ